MMDLFRMEAETHTATLSTGLVELEGESASPQSIEPLMRAAHSVKGAARVVGLDAAVRVAHAMEDCFVAAQKGKLVLVTGVVDLLLSGVDLLIRLSQIGDGELESWQAGHELEIEALIAHLKAAVESGGTPPAEPAPAKVETAEPPVALPPATEPVAETAAPSAAEERPKEEPPNRERDPDRVVRVTAGSLTRLMGLAGESLVATHRLRPLVDALWRSKARQTRLMETVQMIEDRLSNQIGSLPAVERDLLKRALARAGETAQELAEIIDGMEDYSRTSEDISGRLHHEVLTSRMRPIADGLRGFPRLVRDLARELGKLAKFQTIGENTGVDRDILDRLDAPLNHLIRNALDHGLETPEERQTAGKAAAGTIQLEARHRAGMLQIVLSDDGRGIDLDRLRAKVVARGLTTAGVAERLSEAELLEFLFLPGFSTREDVTAVSGRGVGLDVVQSMVQAVRGSVKVSSRFGRGTKFTLQLPITVSVIRALLVEIAAEPYAFPLSRIDRILMLDRTEIRELEGKPHAMVDDQPVGLIEATTVFHLPDGPRREDDGRLPVVVASDRGHRFGVIVDRFLGERDLRVSPLDPRLGKVPDINSSSVLDNGCPVLIVDVEDLIRSIDNVLSGRRTDKLIASTAPQPQGPRHRKILVVDDSITVRELERQLLESQGHIVDTAVDGVDGWNAVRTANYDLVVSDVDMPRMDGIQLVRHIKTDSRLKSIPVVIVSYKDREEDRIRGLDAGADAYLTKSSFHDRTFLGTIADLIGESSGPRTRN
jgi:two-component system sensor histidine kinase and response regulator WspE